MAGLKAFIMFVAACWLLYMALQMGGERPSVQVAGTVATNQTQNAVTNTYSKIEFENMGKINYSLSTMSDSTVDYLKNRSEYKDYLNAKLVIYFTGSNCPYGKAFQRAVNNIKQDSNYSHKYTFYGIDTSSPISKTFSSNEDAQAEVNFSNTCHEFCIINPYNNQIFAIDGVGTEEAEKLGYIFQQLENW